MERHGYVYEDGPPIDYQLRRLPVDRVDSGEEWCGVIISPRLYGRFLHWSGKTKQPCIGEGCLRCAAGIKAPWYGFVHFLRQSPAPQELILEIPALASEALKMYCDRHQSIARLQVKLTRGSSKRNDAVRIGWTVEKWVGELSAEANVPKILDRMFGCSRFNRNDGTDLMRDEIAEAM